MGKKTKLKKIELSSVDMCRRGANQEADIALFKNEEGAPGNDPPADAPEAPGMVEVPNGLWKSILDFAKGLVAKTEPEEAEAEAEGAEAEVEKSAETFEQRRTLQEIRDDRWKYKDALDMSIESIFIDDSLGDEEKNALIDKSVDQFAAAYKEMCAKLLTVRATADKTVATAKSAETDEDQQDKDPDYEEEGEEEMKIDKSRFTAEELEQYTALIAKGRVDEEEFENEENYQEEEEVETKKSMEMHPEVAKALDEMKTIQKSMEMKEMTEIAKKYTLLGKKEEELAETLYNMKKSSPEAYNEYIAVLDQSMSLIEKNGVFAEIGKSSRGMAGGTTEAKIEGIAKSYMEKDPALDYPTALAKAWDNNPDLMAAYDDEY
ncbi:MAG: hypothetical protein IKW37_01470 [Bacteroidaceae bacterium]|nr:hypothetical protein [Bacteroidaceae bacterium]